MFPVYIYFFIFAFVPDEGLRWKLTCFIIIVALISSLYVIYINYAGKYVYVYVHILFIKNNKENIKDDNIEKNN